MRLIGRPWRRVWCAWIDEKRDEGRKATCFVVANRGVTGAYRLESLCLRQLSAEMTLRHSLDSHCEAAVVMGDWPGGAAAFGVW